MRYTATGNAQWTANAEVNGAYWKSVQAGQEYLFDEGMEVEYVSFYLGNGGEVTEVTFILQISSRRNRNQARKKWK